MKTPLQIFQRIALLQRQMGNLSGSILFMQRGADGEAMKVEKETYLVQVKTDLSDVIEQCVQLCQDLDLSYPEVAAIGRERYLETKERFFKRGKPHLWV